MGKATAGLLRGHVPMTCPVLRGAILKSIFSCLIRRLRSQQTEACGSEQTSFSTPPGRRTCVCMAVRTRVPPVPAAHGSQNNSFLFFLLMQFFFFLSALKAAFLPAASMLKKGFVIPQGTGGIKTLRPGFECGRRSSPAPGTPWPAPAPRRIVGRLPGQTVLLPRENSTLQPPAGTRSSGKRRHSGAALLRITGAARSPGGGVWVKVLPC